ncbi:unnamed protein product [Sphacelaria rigidula]
MDHDDAHGSKYSKRSFGHLKNKALTTLGATNKGNLFLAIVMILTVIPLFVRIMFHPIYLNTGTPVFKYGLSMAILGPFYFIWAVLKILSVYLLGMGKA